MLNLSMRLCLGWICSRCSEYFDSVILDERRMEVALYGMTDQVCPTCYSTPAHRDGAPLPPPPIEDEEGEKV